MSKIKTWFATALVAFLGLSASAANTPDYLSFTARGSDMKVFLYNGVLNDRPKTGGSGYALAVAAYEWTTNASAEVWNEFEPNRGIKWDFDAGCDVPDFVNAAFFIPTNVTVYLRRAKGYPAVTSLCDPEDGDCSRCGHTQFKFEGEGAIEAGGSVMSLLDRKCEIDEVGLYAFAKLFKDCTNLTVAPKLPATKLGKACYYNMFEGCTALTDAPALAATNLAERCYEYMFNGCTALTNAPALAAANLADRCYEYMFKDCTSLTNAPALPAMNLAENCYDNMFSMCANLTVAPALPATNLQFCCYSYMFSGCTALADAPALSATNLADGCYEGMFSGCTALTNAPALPATELTDCCYASMFQGCTALTSAPALSAMELDEACYNGMFYGCTLLIEAPVLPATNLANRCYYSMFYDCTNLTEVTVGFTSWNSSCVGYYWLANVAKTGIFTCPADLAVELEGMTRGSSTVPEGWTIVSVGDPTPPEPEDVRFNVSFENLTNVSAVVITNRTMGGECETREKGDTLYIPTNSELSVLFVPARGYDFASGEREVWVDLAALTNAENELSAELIPELKKMVEPPDYFCVRTKGIEYFVRVEIENKLGFDENPIEIEWSNDKYAPACQWKLPYGEDCPSLRSWKTVYFRRRGTAGTFNVEGGALRFHFGVEEPDQDIVSLGGNLMSLVDASCEATAVCDHCFEGLFADCSAIVDASALKLPATTLGVDCYRNMFRDCTQLEAAPFLPATTLAKGCYAGMFYGCSDLQEIRVGFTAWPEDIKFATANWVEGVAQEGVLYAPEAFCDDEENAVYGPDAIPADTENWNWWWDTHVLPEEEDLEPLDPEEYLSFTARGGRVEISSVDDSGYDHQFEYATDPYALSFEWKSFIPYETTVEVNTNDTIYIRRVGEPTDALSCDSSVFSFTMSAVDTGATVEAGGSVMSLLDGKYRRTSVGEYAFVFLFHDCTNLTSAPALPATNLAEYCYFNMFSECTSLTDAPELPAMELAHSCYYDMFNGCVSLTNAPALPATELAENCYRSMFEACTSLTDAPELPAMELARYCYSDMFSGCRSLTNAPALLATTLAEECYGFMFDGCKNLSEVTVGFTEWNNDDYSTSGWLSSVTNTGVIHCPPELYARPFKRGSSTIPKGWTVDCDKSDWVLLRDAVINDKEVSLSCAAFNHNYENGTNVITLLKDITAETNYLSQITVPSGAIATIDLGGFTLDRGLAGNKVGAIDGRIFYLAEDATLSLTNGTLTGGCAEKPKSVGRIVGEGDSDTSYCPAYFYFNYSLSEQIYHADELAAAGLLTTPLESISFYTDDAEGCVFEGTKIWMANVTDDEVGDYSADASEMTLVYDGDQDGVDGWNEFVLNGDFAWDGVSNIRILFQSNRGTWLSSYPYWRASEHDFSAAACDGNDGSPYAADSESLRFADESNRADIMFRCSGDFDEIGEGLPGGAIYGEPGSTLALSDCVVTKNCAGEGGAIYTEGSAVALNGCLFDGNRSTAVSNDDEYCGGGAVALYAASHGYIDDCVFTNNVSAADAGALLVYNDSHASVTNSIFAHNKAEYGGAIVIEDDWGTEYVEKSTLTMADCRIANNTAEVAGAIYMLYNFSVELDRCVFVDNVASNRCGAIYNWSWGRGLACYDCSFVGNHSPWIGAIYNGCPLMFCSGCVFTRNSCEGGASAISSPCCLDLYNCAITNNFTEAPGFNACEIVDCWNNNAWAYRSDLVLFGGNTVITNNFSGGEPSNLGMYRWDDYYEEYIYELDIFRPIRFYAVGEDMAFGFDVYPMVDGLTPVSSNGGETISNLVAKGQIFYEGKDPDAEVSFNGEQLILDYRLGRHTKTIAIPSVRGYETIVSNLTDIVEVVPEATNEFGNVVYRVQDGTDVTVVFVPIREEVPAVDPLDFNHIFTDVVVASDQLPKIEGLPLKDCLSFTARGGDATFGMGIFRGVNAGDNVFEFTSDEGETWTEFRPNNGGTTYALPKDVTVYIRRKSAATDTLYIGDGYPNFWMNGETDEVTVEAGGSVMALLDGNFRATTVGSNGLAFLFHDCDILTVAPAFPAMTLGAACYYDTFWNCYNLVVAPELPATELAPWCYDCMFYECYSLEVAPELPATTMAEGCYDYMFYGCYSLTEAPALPATELAPDCYNGMFFDCWSLEVAPELPATTLAESCYEDMFRCCYSLTEAPELPATTLAESCYEDMFRCCYSLTEAPELPATTLVEKCYYNMFDYCHSLKEAPALPATELAPYCYQYMFWGCTNLSKVTVGFTEWNTAGNSTVEWLCDVAPAGVFNCPEELEIIHNDEGDYVPYGWTVVHGDVDLCTVTLKLPTDQDMPVSVSVYNETTEVFMGSYCIEYSETDEVKVFVPAGTKLLIGYLNYYDGYVVTGKREFEIVVKKDTTINNKVKVVPGGEIHFTKSWLVDEFCWEHGLEMMPEGAVVKGQGAYKEGAKAKLTAKPPKGYAFAGWWDIGRAPSEDHGFAPIPFVGENIAEDFRSPTVTVTMGRESYAIFPVFIKQGKADWLNAYMPEHPLPLPFSKMSGVASDMAVSFLNEEVWASFLAGDETIEIEDLFTWIVPAGSETLKIDGSEGPSQKQISDALVFTAGVPVTNRVFVWSGSLPTVNVTGLPKGVKFDKKSGRLTGTPTVPGVSYVTISVKNVSGYVTEKIVPVVVRNYDQGIRMGTVAVEDGETGYRSVRGRGYDVVGRIDTLREFSAEADRRMADALEDGIFMDSAYDREEAPRFQVGDSIGFKPTFVSAVEGLTIKKIAKKSLPSGLKYDAKTGFITGTVKKAGSYAAVFNVTIAKNERLGIMKDMVVPTSMIFIVDEQGYHYSGYSPSEQPVKSVKNIPFGIEGMTLLTWIGRGRYSHSYRSEINTYTITGLGWLLPTNNIRRATILLDNGMAPYTDDATLNMTFLEFSRYLTVGTTLNGAFAYGFEGKPDLELPIAAIPGDAKANYIKVKNLPTGLKLVTKADKQTGVTLYTVVGTATKTGVFNTKWEIRYEGTSYWYNRRYVVTAGASGWFDAKPYEIDPDYFDYYGPDATDAEFAFYSDFFKDTGSLAVTGGGLFTPASKLTLTATPADGYAFCGWQDSSAANHLYPKRGRTSTRQFMYGSVEPTITLTAPMAKSYAGGYFPEKILADPARLTIDCASVKVENDFCGFARSLPKKGVVDEDDLFGDEYTWIFGAKTKDNNPDAFSFSVLGYSAAEVTVESPIPAGFRFAAAGLEMGGDRCKNLNPLLGRACIFGWDTAETAKIVPGTYDVVFAAKNASGQTARFTLHVVIDPNLTEVDEEGLPIIEPYLELNFFCPEYVSSSLKHRPVVDFEVVSGRTYAAEQANRLSVWTESYVEKVWTKPALPEGLAFTRVDVEDGIARWYLTGSTTAAFDTTNLVIYASCGAITQRRYEEMFTYAHEDLPELENHLYTEMHVVAAEEPAPLPEPADEPFALVATAGVGSQFGSDRLPYLPEYDVDENGKVIGYKPVDPADTLPMNGTVDAGNTNLCCAVGVKLVLTLTGADGAAVTVTGLPKGLKFTSVAVTDKVCGEVAANSIYGVPTEPGTSAVTLTAAERTLEFNLTVLATPEWAVGEFEGVLNLGVIDPFSLIFDLSDISAETKGIGLANFRSQYWKSVGFGPFGMITSALKGLGGMENGKFTCKIDKNGKVTGSATIFGKPAKLTLNGFDAARVATTVIDPTVRKSDSDEINHKKRRLYGRTDIIALDAPWALGHDPQIIDPDAGLPNKDGGAFSDNWAYFDETDGLIKYYGIDGVEIEYGYVYDDETGYMTWKPIANPVFALRSYAPATPGEPKAIDALNIVRAEQAFCAAKMAELEPVSSNLKSIKDEVRNLEKWADECPVDAEIDNLAKYVSQLQNAIESAIKSGTGLVQNSTKPYVELSAGSQGAGGFFSPLDMRLERVNKEETILTWKRPGYNGGYVVRLPLDVPYVTEGQMYDIVMNEWIIAQERLRELASEGGAALDRDKQVIQDLCAEYSEQIAACECYSNYVNETIDDRLEGFTTVACDTYVPCAPFVDAYTAKAEITWNGKTYTTSITLTELNRKTRELVTQYVKGIESDMGLTVDGVPEGARNWKDGSSVGFMFMGPLCLLNGVGYDAADDAEIFDIVETVRTYPALVTDRVYKKGDDGKFADHVPNAERDWALEKIEWMRSKAFGAATKKVFGTAYTLPESVLAKNNETLANFSGLFSGVGKLLEQILDSQAAKALIDEMGTGMLGTDLALNLDTFSATLKPGALNAKGVLNFAIDVNYNGTKSTLKFSGTALPLAVAAPTDPAWNCLLEEELNGKISNGLKDLDASIFIANCTAVAPRDYEWNGVTLVKKGTTLFLPVPLVFAANGGIDQTLTEAAVDVVLKMLFGKGDAPFEYVDVKFGGSSFSMKWNGKDCYEWSGGYSIGTSKTIELYADGVKYGPNGMALITGGGSYNFEINKNPPSGIITEFAPNTTATILSATFSYYDGVGHLEILMMPPMPMP